MRLAGADRINATTRQALTFALVCANTGTEGRSLAVEPELPESWRSLTPRSEFTLEAGEADIRVFAVLVPPQAAAGTYLIPLRMKDLGDPAVFAECTLAVAVPREIALDVRLLEAPTFVVAGKEYTATFSISNNGNVDLSAVLQIRSEYSFPYTATGLDGPTELELPVGDLREIGVTVRTDRGLLQSVKHQLRVTARPREQEDASADEARRTRAQSPSATSTVEVVPLSVGAGTLMHSIPATMESLGVVSYDQGLRAEIQESVKAKGTLDEEGRHSIELELRKWLSSDSDSFFGAQDRISLAYRHRLGEIRVGDLAYSVSPLLAMNQFARGVQGTVNLLPFRVGAQIYRDAWSVDGAQALAGTADFSVTGEGTDADPAYRVGLNVLTPLDRSVSFGIWQQWSPLEQIELELDAALQRDPSGRWSPAVFALAQGDLGPISVLGRFIRAWPEFRGAYHDTQSLLARTSVRLLGGVLNLSGGFTLTMENLLLDPAQTTAITATRIAGGVGLKIPAWAANLSLNWENDRRLDRLPTPGTDSWDNLLRMSWRQSFGPLGLTVGSSVGYEVNAITDGSALRQEQGVSLQYAPSLSSRYAVSLRFGGLYGSGGPPSHRLGADLGARWTWDRGGLSLSLRNGYSFDASSLTGLSVGGGAKLTNTLAWGHTLTAEAEFLLSYAPATWQPGFTVSVGYSIPVSVPVSRKPDTAIVKGFVYHVPSGERLSDVLLRLNGLAAVTNKNGEFAFYLPQSGRPYLQIYAGSVGANLIPSMPMPAEVAAPPGSLTSLEIGMVEGCTVSGTVSVFGFPSQSDAYATAESQGERAGGAEPRRVRLGGSSKALVELSDGLETRRRLTGPGGDFIFLDVRPGAYTLRFIDARLPSYHHVEQETYEIELAPGEDREIEFRVVQERRTINLIESGLSVSLEPEAVLREGARISVEPTEPVEQGAPDAAPAPQGGPEATALAEPAVESASPAAMEPPPAAETAAPVRVQATSPAEEAGKAAEKASSPQETPRDSAATAETTATAVVDVPTVDKRDGTLAIAGTETEERPGAPGKQSESRGESAQPAAAATDERSTPAAVNPATTTTAEEATRTPASPSLTLVPSVPSPLSPASPPESSPAPANAPQSRPTLSPTPSPVATPSPPPASQATPPAPTPAPAPTPSPSTPSPERLPALEPAATVTPPAAAAAPSGSPTPKPTPARASTTSPRPLSTVPAPMPTPTPLKIPAPTPTPKPLSIPAPTPTPMPARR